MSPPLSLCLDANRYLEVAPMGSGMRPSEGMEIQEKAHGTGVIHTGRRTGPRVMQFGARDRTLRRTGQCVQAHGTGHLGARAGN